MATVDQFSQARRSETVAVTSFFQDLGERFSKYREFQRTINELSALSSRDLADLGLTRATIRSTAYEAVYGA